MLKPVIFSGTSNLPLAEDIARNLGLSLGARRLTRSPDGEVRANIEENIRARDVFLIQPISPPPDQNLMELLFLADACRRSGAINVTAVVPYFGYSRQSWSEHGRGAIGARLIADLLRMAGISRVVTADLHGTAIESAFAVAIDHLRTVPLLLEALVHQPLDGVVVAADMAALSIAEQYGRALNLPIAIVAKVRINDEQVVARNVIGDVRGKRPIIVDDMIITGATIDAALNACVTCGAVPNATVLAAHGLFVGNAMPRLAALPITRLLVTDSVQISRETALNAKLPLEVKGLAPILAQAISRLQVGESLDDLTRN